MCFLFRNGSNVYVILSSSLILVYTFSLSFTKLYICWYMYVFSNTRSYLLNGLKNSWQRWWGYFTHGIWRKNLYISTKQQPVFRVLHKVESRYPRFYFIIYPPTKAARADIFMNLHGWIEWCEVKCTITITPSLWMPLNVWLNDIKYTLRN